VSQDHAAAETREYGRSAAQLTVALGLAGVLTYVFFALASRGLDKDQYGEIVVLWSAVFLLGATLFRPIEQLLARTLAEREHAGADTRDALRAAGLIQGGLCALAVVVLVALRPLVQDQLFSEDHGLYWALIVAIAGFGLAYYARGFLAGRGQFFLYAVLLLIEVLLRLVCALIVAVGIAGGTGLIAIGIAIAPIAGLIVLPIAIRAPRTRGTVDPEASPVGGELTLGSGGAFAFAVLLMMLSEQVLVSSGALFVRAAEGAAAAGFIFNVLMVARAPLLLFQAIAASLLPHLTRLRAKGGESSGDAFKSSLEGTMLLIVAFATLTTIGVLLVGPQVMQIAFGDKFEYDRLGLAIVSVGMGFYLVAASLNQAVLAQGQARRAAIPWVICAGLFVIYNLVSPGDPFRAVEVGFAGGAALLSGLLYLVYAHPHPNVADTFEPGSGREVQARLDALDEIA
jgi:O-antigen/teichoic acid export membrane protein